MLLQRTCCQKQWLDVDDQSKCLHRDSEQSERSSWAQVTEKAQVSKRPKRRTELENRKEENGHTTDVKQLFCVITSLFSKHSCCEKSKQWNKKARERERKKKPVTETSNSVCCDDCAVFSWTVWNQLFFSLLLFISFTVFLSIPKFLLTGFLSRSFFFHTEHLGDSFAELSCCVCSVPFLRDRSHCFCIRFFSWFEFFVRSSCIFRLWIFFRILPFFDCNGISCENLSIEFTRRVGWQGFALLSSSLLLSLFLCFILSHLADRDLCVLSSFVLSCWRDWPVDSWSRQLSNY